MTTPEGKVKRDVRKVLAKYKGLYEYWPVPAGYGPSSLDCIICFCGKFIAIETKAPGKKPTPRQRMVIEQIRQAGGFAGVIDGKPEQLANLAALMERIQHEARSNKPSA